MLTELMSNLMVLKQTGSYILQKVSGQFPFAAT